MKLVKMVKRFVLLSGTVFPLGLNRCLKPGSFSEIEAYVIGVKIDSGLVFC